MSKYIDADALMEYLRGIKQQAEADNKTKIDALESTIDVINTTIMMKTDEIMRIVENMPAADVEPVRKWIKASEKKPVFPCITIDGFGNYPKAAIGIYSLTKENGETLYFTADLIRDKGVTFDGEWVQPLLDKPNNIAYWMPLPEPPKMDGGSE